MIISFVAVIVILVVAFLPQTMTQVVKSFLMTC